MCPNTVVRLNAGTYHIVSEYGDTQRLDPRRHPGGGGKLTEATIQHKAAQITFKLVSEAGGEAIADTAWSILTAAGDSVGESVSAFPTMVLAEGEYSAVARNKDKIYQRDFKVEAGKNTDVEVLMKDVQPEEPTGGGKNGAGSAGSTTRQRVTLRPGRRRHCPLMINCRERHRRRR